MKLFIAAVFLLAVLPVKAADPQPFQTRPFQLDRPFPTMPDTTIPLKPEDWWMVPAIQEEQKVPVGDFRSFQRQLDAPGPGY